MSRRYRSSRPGLDQIGPAPSQAGRAGALYRKQRQAEQEKQVAKLSPEARAQMETHTHHRTFLSTLRTAQVAHQGRAKHQPSLPKFNLPPPAEADLENSS